jgi:IMP dehydrogenase/GMP reductase
MQQGLEFDDVLIKPIASEITSRDEVDISVRLSDRLTLDFPLIASPMVGVVDGKFAKTLSTLGGIAILHRFYKDRESLFLDIRQNLSAYDKYGVSIKIGEENFEEYLQRTVPNILLIDTANGYNRNLLKYCEKVKNYISKNFIQETILLMAGNVVDYGGCSSLGSAGCDLIRVGIGGGSPCSTRNQTGIGVPNITAIDRCWTGVGQNDEFKLVIDGGIKNSGDFVKAIVAGADLGMAGKLFAETFEAPNDGVLYGMASRTHMENTKIPIKSIEGFDTKITKKHSLADFVREFGYGIKSAGTYLNARNLQDMFVHGEFIQVTDHAIKKGL